MLDAWYSHRRGIRQTPTSRPALNSNARLLQLVDTLTARREPGWLTTGTTLLEGSPKIRQQWAAQGPALAKLSRQDGRSHSCTFVGGHRADASFLLVWASLAPGQPVADVERGLSDYLAAKKHQIQVIRGAVLLFDANGLVRMLFNNSRLGPDQTLDAEVVRLGLKPVEEMTHRPPPPRKAKPKSRRRR